MRERARIDRWKGRARPLPAATWAILVCAILAGAVGPAGFLPASALEGLARAGGPDEAAFSPSAAGRIEIFTGQGIHFDPEDSTRYATPPVRVREGGRVASRALPLAPLPRPCRITACVAIHPIPKAADEVCDRWDRAGNLRLSPPGMAPIEMVKFVTAYGGETRHRTDVSHLAPLLAGPCTFEGFIDTWVSPAWTIDAWLEVAPFDTTAQWEPAWDAARASWVEGLYYSDALTAENQPPEGLEGEIEIPAGTRRVVLHYYASGHCTDGRDAEEFVPKDHVLTVDGRVVHRFRPWRMDCRQFRAINPYCRRWSDGYWSSDFSRSGWCPGDRVEPLVLDLTDALPPGRHRLSARVEPIRPRDEAGHYGYWRISGHLIGWSEPGPAGP